MKKPVALVVAMSMLLAACGRPMNAGGKHYPTYGLFNSTSSKSKNVCYEVSVGNVIWSILLAETVIFPVYFIGWSILNPVRLKQGPDDQCTLDG